MERTHQEMARRLGLLILLVACWALATAGASSAKRTDGAGGYTLVESATLVQPGNASPTGAEATSTGPDPFTWGRRRPRHPGDVEASPADGAVHRLQARRRKLLGRLSAVRGVGHERCEQLEDLL